MEREADGRERDPRGRARRAVGVVAVLLLVVAAGSWWPRDDAPSVAPGPGEVQRLTASGTVLRAALSPDGDAIAWVEASGGRQGLWIRAVRGTHPEALVAPAEVEYSGLTFTADGTRIVYAARGARQLAGAVFVVDVGGGRPERVLDGIEGVPALSRDGRLLAFHRSAHPGHGMTALVVAGLDGTGERTVATLRSPEAFVVPGSGAPSWSPDGRVLATLVHDTEAGSARVATVDVASGAVARVSGPFRDATTVAWLPDGRGLLVQGARPDAGLPSAGGVWLQPYPAGLPRRVTPDPLVYDGISLRLDGSAFVTVGLDATYSIWQVPLALGEESARLAAEPGDGRLGVAPLADGRLVVAAGGAGSEQLALIDPDGATRQILTTRGTNRSPAATPDGRTVVFVSDRDGRHGIWRLDLDGSEPRLLAHVSNPSWLSVTPDGLFVIGASRESLAAAASTWRVSVEGGEPAIIAPGIDRPRVSPDGALLAGVTVAPQGDRLILVTMRLDGRAPPRALGTAVPSANGGLLEWTPEGDGLLFSDADRIDVWMQPLSGDRPLRVTSLADLRIVRGRATPDGRGLIVTRGRERSDVYLISGFR